MTFRIYTVAGALVAAGMMATAAQASYFVRPYAQVGGTVSDGLEVDQATSKSSSVGSAATVAVDLDDGTVHSYLLRDQSIPGGTAFAQAAGIFGDRVTFYGGEGTDVTFSFAFDGSIVADAQDGSETLQFGAYASLYVFDVSAGATYANFTTLAGALVKQTWSAAYFNPQDDVNEWIDEALSGMVSLSGSGTYDVFAFLNLSAVTNNNSSTVELDFRNTGTFGITVAPGVSYSSSSGVFLDSVAPQVAVPEPASWALMIGGIAAVGGALRRRAVRVAFA